MKMKKIKKQFGYQSRYIYKRLSWLEDLCDWCERWFYLLMSILVVIVMVMIALGTI